MKKILEKKLDEFTEKHEQLIKLELQKEMNEVKRKIDSLNTQFNKSISKKQFIR